MEEKKNDNKKQSGKKGGRGKKRMDGKENGRVGGM